MLPVTQASLVSRMRADALSRGLSPELEWYARSEYGANASYIRAMVEQSRKTWTIRTGPGSLVRRVLATVWAALAAARANPGGA